VEERSGDRRRLVPLRVLQLAVRRHHPMTPAELASVRRAVRSGTAAPEPLRPAARALADATLHSSDSGVAPTWLVYGLGVLAVLNLGRWVQDHDAPWAVPMAVLYALLAAGSLLLRRRRRAAAAAAVALVLGVVLARRWRDRRPRTLLRDLERDVRAAHPLGESQWQVVCRSVQRGEPAPDPLRPAARAYAEATLRSSDLGMAHPLLVRAQLVLGSPTRRSGWSHSAGPASTTSSCWPRRGW
jgi:hypothetical protein